MPSDGSESESFFIVLSSRSIFHATDCLTSKLVCFCLVGMISLCENTELSQVKVRKFPFRVEMTNVAYFCEINSAEKDTKIQLGA